MTQYSARKQRAEKAAKCRKHWEISNMAFPEQVWTDADEAAAEDREWREAAEANAAAEARYWDNGGQGYSLPDAREDVLEVALARYS